MRVCHTFTAVFDDRNLVSPAGLVPVMELAERAGLHRLTAGHLSVGSRPGGVNAHLKVPGLVAGMMAGADSIDDMDLLRHGAMGKVFGGVRAPSTLGTFLRAFTFGHVRQLDAVNSRLLAELSRRAPLLPGAAGPEGLAYVDVDDTVKPTYGYSKEGAGRGYSGVKGLNALLGIVSTPGSQPVICAARLRKGSANSARGAARLIADALAAAKACGATGTRVLRADSAYYNAEVIAAARRSGAHFSVTARQDRRVRAAIDALTADPSTVWTTVRYPHALYDEDSGTWVSDAEIAETSFTAFTSRPQAKQVTARLLVRRVPDRNPAHQNPLFTVYRHHAVFTDSPLPLVAAEAAHRAHAIVEQVIADLKGGPLAHLPSGRFTANAAWLACAVIAHNLLRAAGALAGTFHAHARTATLRAHLINVPARLARSARHTTLHLPTEWPWEQAWQTMTAAIREGPPTPALT